MGLAEFIAAVFTAFYESPSSCYKVRRILYALRRVRGSKIAKSVRRLRRKNGFMVTVVCGVYGYQDVIYVGKFLIWFA